MAHFRKILWLLEKSVLQKIASETKVSNLIREIKLHTLNAIIRKDQKDFCKKNETLFWCIWLEHHSQQSTVQEKLH